MMGVAQRLDSLNQRSPNPLFLMVREDGQTVDPTLADVVRAVHGAQAPIGPNLAEINRRARCQRPTGLAKLERGDV